MTNVSNNPELDNELAAITDQLLAGKDPMERSISPENEALAQVVKRLYSTIGSPSSGMSNTAHNRLTQRLNEEWATASRQPPQTRFSIGRNFSPRTMRVLSVAAAIAIVMFFVFIVMRGQGPTEPVIGSAVGTTGNQIAIPIVIVGVLALAGAGFWWIRRR